MVAIANKVNLEPGQVIAIGIVVWALFIVLTMGATILTLTISVLYPAFKSVQALETKDTDDDDKIWLTYWCVFGGFTLLDEFLGFILNMIPFYFYIKVGFFLWLMLPQT
jgi:receptor expression-enhancing protein 5/6